MPKKLDAGLCDAGQRRIPIPIRQRLFPLSLGTPGAALSSSPIRPRLIQNPSKTLPNQPPKPCSPTAQGETSCPLQMQRPTTITNEPPLKTKSPSLRFFVKFFWKATISGSCFLLSFVPSIPIQKLQYPNKQTLTLLSGLVVGWPVDWQSAKLVPAFCVVFAIFPSLPFCHSIIPQSISFASRLRDSALVESNN